MTFTRPVRIAPSDGSAPTRRLLAANLSDGGMFVRCYEPLPKGARVRIALEAQGRPLPFAEAEVVWQRSAQRHPPKGHLPGFGLRFVSFATPRAEELVQYLIKRQAIGAEAPPPALPDSPSGVPSGELPKIEVQLFEPQASPPPLAAPLLQESFEPTWVDPLQGIGVPLHRQQAEPALELPPGLPEGIARPPGARLLFASGAVVVFALAAAALLFSRDGEGAKAALLPPSPLRAEEAPFLASPLEAKVELPPEATTVLASARKPATAPVEASQQLALAGAVDSVQLSWQQGKLVLRPKLAEGASIERVFSLSAPTRLVVDVEGKVPPSASEHPLSKLGYARGLRVGKRPHGLRLVLDLERPVGELTREDGALVLRWE